MDAALVEELAAAASGGLEVISTAEPGAGDAPIG